MDRIYAHITAGVTAADARVRVRQGFGGSWHAVSPCQNVGLFMASTGNKRQPRRLGQRST